MKKINFFFLWLLTFLTFLNIAQAQILWKDYPGKPVMTNGPTGSWDFHWIAAGINCSTGFTIHNVV